MFQIPSPFIHFYNVKILTSFEEESKIPKIPKRPQELWGWNGRTKSYWLKFLTGINYNFNPLPTQHFVKVATFQDFARYVCAFREYPLRVYSHDFKGQKVFSSGMTLSNSVLLFYTPFTKEGAYISYSTRGGHEHYDIVNTTRIISNYAPIIHLESLPSPFKTSSRDIEDKFWPIHVKDLASLARLTYDPEYPDEPKLTLFLFPHKNKWVIGFVSSIDTDDVVYCFNYVTLDKEPTKSFLKYTSHTGSEPKFTDKFEHGYPYLPVVKLVESHPIFGIH